MKARISNNTIVEILAPADGFDIQDSFHPSLLAMCIDIPEGAEVGWVLQNGEWISPSVDEVTE